MIAYSTIGSNDLDAARKFYGALFEEIGAKEIFVRPDGGYVAFGADLSKPFFGVAKPYDGKEASPGNGNMVAIAVASKEQVKSLYDKAISLGATCAGEPGPRIGGQAHCGYVHDPEGNKLNFFYMGA